MTIAEFVREIVLRPRLKQAGCLVVYDTDQRFREEHHETIHKLHIKCLMVNDYHGDKLKIGYMNLMPDAYKTGAYRERTKKFNRRVAAGD